MAALCPRCLTEVRTGVYWCPNCGAEQPPANAAMAQGWRPPDTPEIDGLHGSQPAPPVPPPLSFDNPQTLGVPAPPPASGRPAPATITGGAALPQPRKTDPPPFAGAPSAPGGQGASETVPSATGGPSVQGGSTAGLLGPTAQVGTSTPAVPSSHAGAGGTAGLLGPAVQVATASPEAPRTDAPSTTDTDRPDAAAANGGGAAPNRGAGVPNEGGASQQPYSSPPIDAGPIGPGQFDHHTAIRAKKTGLGAVFSGRRAIVFPVVAAVVVAVLVVALLAVGGGSKSHSTLGTKPASKTDTPTKPGGSTKSHTVASHASSSPTLSVPLKSGGTDPIPLVQVSIGNDKTLNVMLDTGSVGLRVFSNVLPTGDGLGINVTNTPDEVEYADGTIYDGVVADALVHIHGLSTTRVVDFQYVQDVTCDPSFGFCPSEGGAASSEAEGVDGIMGIGIGGSYAGDPTTNPLLSLPSPYRNSWSVGMQGGGILPATGALLLGAHDPKTSSAQLQLQAGGASVNGSPTWNDFFNLCWDISGITNCELSVFDSGSDLTILEGQDFAEAPTDDPGFESTLSSGTNVSVSTVLDGNPLWSFNAGSGPMQTVIVEPSGAGIVNSGVQAFYTHTITYDEVNGIIYLS
jgi:Protein of unknown function (DUF3443)